MLCKNPNSPTGNWTRVSRVTGGDTHHYTIEDFLSPLASYTVGHCTTFMFCCKPLKTKNLNSPTGNWTRVSRVTGGDTHHYTIEDFLSPLASYTVGHCTTSMFCCKPLKTKNLNSPTGNWTRVSRVTGGDTHHYTIEDFLSPLASYTVGHCTTSMFCCKPLKTKNLNSPTGNWTRVSRVTGGDTHHYTIKDLMCKVITSQVCMLTDMFVWW